MKALSLTEPWCTLVAIGAKKIETRSWSTPYRGPLAIHASKGFSGDCRDLCFEEPFKAALLGAGHGLDAETFALGHIIALAELTDCFRFTADVDPGEPERSFGDYTPGRFGFVLSNVRRLKVPVAARGALGLWVVPADLAATCEVRAR